MQYLYEHRIPATRAVVRRVLSPTLRTILERRGASADWQQEVLLCQWEQRGNGDIPYMRALNRALYHWLRAEGYVWWGPARLPRRLL